MRAGQKKIGKINLEYRKKCIVTKDNGTTNQRQAVTSETAQKRVN